MQISRSKLPGFAQNAFCYSQTRVVSAETSFDTLIEGSKLGIGSELDMKITSDAGSAIPLIGVAHKFWITSVSLNYPLRQSNFVSI